MAAGLIEALIIQRRVLGALVLRDMRTRFGRSFMGYVIIVCWPLSHLLGLMSIYLVTRRVAPVGASVPIFLGTGILPYILCLYPARQIMLALAMNQPLLHFPVVKATDIVLARGILEVLTAFWVTLIFATILFVCGVDIVPIHYQDAIQAILATIYLGFAIGFISALLFKLTRAWLPVQVVLIIVLYVTAGVFFIPSALPDNIQNILWYNPLLHCVEWMRSAYYDGYGYGLLDRGYLVSFSTFVIALSLVVERAVRGRLLQG